MTDSFPDALIRYSVNDLPHTVINGRVHVEGVLEEHELLRRIAAAVRSETESANSGPD
jgi:hypothetical protein